MTATSQEAVLVGDEGEAVEGVAGAGAGVELGGPAHGAGDHLSGELGVDVLGVRRAFLEGSGMNHGRKTVLISLDGIRVDTTLLILRRRN